MSSSQTIAGELRADVGKGASRRLRHSGKIPAVLYGGQLDPVALTFEHRDILHAAQTESFFSSILEVSVGDDRQQVVLRDLQRHPFRQQILHLDFQRVLEAEELRISVPIHFVGEDFSPAGKASGVVIQHLVTEVEISALPRDLPEYLEVDLSAIDAGDAVMLADIGLPDGVKIPALAVSADHNVMVANAIHISETQGTGAAAAAEAEALAEAEGELLVDEMEAEDQAADEDEEARVSEAGDASEAGEGE